MLGKQIRFKHIETIVGIKAGGLLDKRAISNGIADGIISGIQTIHRMINDQVFHAVRLGFVKQLEDLPDMQMTRGSKRT